MMHYMINVQLLPNFITTDTFNNKKLSFINEKKIDRPF